MMSHKMSKQPRESDSRTQPRITTYDSGYQYSVEHWFEVQKLVEEADEAQA
jgi:hypothetical protein